MQIINLILLFAVITGLSITESNAQFVCDPDLLTGNNLLTNGDFSGGYANWTYTADTDGNPNTPAANNPNGYIIFNPPATQNYSQPGFIYAGSTPSLFNAAFGLFNDHTPTGDNMMLMVDGVCSNGIKLWSQSGIPISPNTDYYFTIWVHALKDANSPPGTLQFDINGANLATTITAPTSLAGDGTNGGWVQYEAIWNSGATPPATATISIENTTVTGCDQFVDFAIDDVSFIPGCSYASATTAITPNLGPDVTICGKGGSSFTLNVVDEGITDVNTNQIWWSDNASISGLGGAGNTGVFNRTFTPSGPYPMEIAVCTKVGGGCIKTDKITISGDYSINISDVNLCSPSSTTLDAVFTGTGVTYQWYKESNSVAGWQQADTIPASKARTLFVNTAGTYRVVVNDPLACGIREDIINVTTSAPTPVNKYFCPTTSVTLEVTPANSGKYKWWSAATGGTLLKKGGDTYTFTASATSDYTFWVEDTSAFRTTIGPALTGNGFTSGGQRGVQNETQLYFDALTNITIDTVYMRVISYACPTPIGLTVNNADGTVRGSVTYNYGATAADGCLAGGTWQWAKIPVNVVVPPGTGYSIRYQEPAGNNTDMEWFNAGMTYPQTYSSAVKFNGPATGQPAGSVPGMFRWVISAGTPCARIPVKAIYNCTLPVEFLEFEANPVGEKVLLTWSTAWEEQNAYFVVERSSDGVTFEGIGQVSGNGTSSTGFSYSMYDNMPLNGTSYYRIAQHDMDGVVSYGPVRTVRTEGFEVIVSPNPNNGSFRVSFLAVEGEEVKISLRNAFGQVVYAETIEASSENFSKDLNLQSLNSNIYYLHVESINQKSITKVVKE